MALKLVGTREQKENKARNTGTKAVFGEQGTPKSKKILLRNKGTQGKFCWSTVFRNVDKLGQRIRKNRLVPLR